MENNNATYPPLGARGYKHVFIDLDDTIWDFHTNAKSSLHQVFIEKELNRWFSDFEHFFSIYAKRNLELWEQYGKGEISKEYLQIERFHFPLKKMGVTNEILAEQIGSRFLELLPTKTALLPHAIEILEYLSKKYTLSIISNGFIEVQYKKLEATRIGHYFKHIILSEEVGALKPDKRIFEHALQLNQALSHEAIMIGDSYEADIRGAQNAGIDQIFLSQSTPAGKTTYHIHQLDEIMDIL